MSFFLEFVRMKIVESMESDADRRQKWEENLTREARLAASSYVHVPCNNTDKFFKFH